MRKLSRLLAATLVAGTLVTGCTDVDADSSLTASIEGTGNFTASTIQGSYADNVLAFSGFNSTAQILVTVPNVTAPGPFALGVGQAGVAQVVVGSAVWTTALTGGTGQVVVTSISSTSVSGSFTFTGAASTGGATGTKTVTSGEFTVSF